MRVAPDLSWIDEKVLAIVREPVTAEELWRAFLALDPR